MYRIALLVRFIDLERGETLRDSFKIKTDGRGDAAVEYLSKSVLMTTASGFIRHGRMIEGTEKFDLVDLVVLESRRPFLVFGHVDFSSAGRSTALCHYKRRSRWETREAATVRAERTDADRAARADAKREKRKNTLKL